MVSLDDTGLPDAKTSIRQGHRLRQQGDWLAAFAAYQRALAVQPACGLAHQALGFTLLQQQLYPEAVLHLAKALRLQPESARLHVGYGNALCGLDQYEQALGHYRRALALRPNVPAITFRLAHALRRLNRLEESLGYYQQALQQCPENPSMHYDYAAALIALGRLREGFRQYEGRRRRIQPDVAPTWRGENLKGRTILLYREQGLGDTIQFVRFVPEVARRGAKVILQCQSPLVRLCRTLAGVHQVVVNFEDLPPLDYQCSVMSLVDATQATWATLSAEVPYLRVPQEVHHPLPQAHPGRPLKVGVSWAGATETDYDRERSIALHQLTVLVDCPGVTFYSLQKGERAADLKHVSGASAVLDLAPHLGDFADTAAFLTQLDVVISVDTSVAHLAGALGKTVWLLLPYAPDWRWMLQREDSPWYPTARLFRQRQRGDWDDVIARLKAHLANELRAP